MGADGSVNLETVARQILALVPRAGHRRLSGGCYQAFIRREDRHFAEIGVEVHSFMDGKFLAAEGSLSLSTEGCRWTSHKNLPLIAAAIEAIIPHAEPIFTIECPRVTRGKVFLRPALPNDIQTHPVVWVDLPKFMDTWYRGSDPANNLPRYEVWDEDEQQGIARFLCEGEGFACIARVACEMEFRVARRWFGCKRHEYEFPRIAFINGRHRMSFMHAMGATKAPVQIHYTHAEILQAVCGTDGEGT